MLFPCNKYMILHKSSVTLDSSLLFCPSILHLFSSLRRPRGGAAWKFNEQNHFKRNRPSRRRSTCCPCWIFFPAITKYIVLLLYSVTNAGLEYLLTFLISTLDSLNFAEFWSVRCNAKNVGSFVDFSLLGRPVLVKDKMAGPCVLNDTSDLEELSKPQVMKFWGAYQ